MNDTAFKAITRAKNQVDGGNPEGAVDTLEEYLATDPHNTAPRLTLANIALNDLKEERYGLMQLDIILDLEPDNLDALKAKASYLAQDKRNNKETDDLFKRILEVDSSSDVYNEYARFLRNQITDFKKAGEYYEKAITSDPSNFVYHQNYAALLLNDLKDYPRAKIELEKLMDLKPGDPKIKKNYDRLMTTKFRADGTEKKSLGRMFRKK